MSSLWQPVSLICLSEGCKADIVWWIEFVRAWNGISFPQIPAGPFKSAHSSHPYSTKLNICHCLSLSPPAICFMLNSHPLASWSSFWVHMSKSFLGTLKLHLRTTAHCSSPLLWGWSTTPTTGVDLLQRRFDTLLPIPYELYICQLWNAIKVDFQQKL